MRNRTLVVRCGLLVVVTSAGCRDVGEPFRPADADTTTAGTTRLTYAAGDDRSPSWSVSGDTIFYTSSSWEGNTLAPGTILAIPADGSGPARPALQGVQNGPAARNWLTSQAIAPGGERTAFIRVQPLQPATPCDGIRLCSADDESLPSVRLTGIELHVRDRDAIDGLADDAILPLAMAGRSFVQDTSAPTGVVTISEYHPFQRLFAIDRHPFFRPSWRPDGGVVVVSDGLHLYSWTPGASDPVRIPGTDDGLMPAWSPDGEWIAYARHQRIASVDMTCDYWWENARRCTERRIMHQTAPPQIVLTRPDGSSERLLFDDSGSDPAWSPDGRFIFVSTWRGLVFRQIERVDVETGAVEVIAGTGGGVEPAVSPDGRRLAFARRGNAGYDVWIVDLP